MTKYKFRIRLPVKVDEKILEKELADMMEELIARHGKLHIDINVRYKPGDYEIGPAWELE